MNPDDVYRRVMVTEPPVAATPLDSHDREHLFGMVWGRPGLSIRDRRIVTLVCVSAAVDVPAMDAHVHAALATARGLDPAAVATILAAGSGRSYAADVVAGGGFDLDGLAAVAGELLAKDVGILADRAGPAASSLLAAADAALARMGVARPTPGQEPT